MVRQSPYNALKMKKKLQDMKELLAYRTDENEELKRNTKVIKVQQLQKMLKIQDKNIMRLKNIAQKAINMVRSGDRTERDDQSKLAEDELAHQLRDFNRSQMEIQN